MKHGLAENIQSSERIEVGADIQKVFHCERIRRIFLDEKANGVCQHEDGAFINFTECELAIYRLEESQT
jgi:hypothetical protein